MTLDRDLNVRSGFEGNSQFTLLTPHPERNIIGE